VNGRALAERLESAGLDREETPAKTRLYDAVLSTLRGSTGSDPASICWVPGRLEVFGTHTDYAGGRTLVAALPRGFAFAGRSRADDSIRITDASSGETAQIDTRGKPSHASGWGHYVEVVAHRLARNFPGANLGAEIAFASDLPRAAGMSSSSALMVGVASTLITLSGLRLRPEWRDNVRGPVDEAGYYACLENGRSFGTLAGDAGVGTHGGSEDHAAMLCGAPDTLSAFRFVPMQALETVRLPADWSFVVASTGVAAEKTGAALQPYNRLARGAAILLDLWNESGDRARSLAAALASETTAADRLRGLVAARQVDGWSTAALQARLEHFIREDARIPAAAQAFRDCSPRALSDLAADSQRDSETLLRNQVDQSITLARTAAESGAFASRSFGAGFGGSVWALVRAADAREVETRWLGAYAAKYPALRPVGFTVRPGPGLVEL
jgi:galactokinase